LVFSERRKRAPHASRDGVFVRRRVHADANDGHGVHVTLPSQPPGRLDQRHVERAQQTTLGTASQRYSAMLSGIELAHQVKETRGAT